MNFATQTSEPAPHELNAAALRALEARDFPAAAQLLQRALALDAGNVTYWLNLAAAMRGNGDAASALTVLDKALSLDPRSFHALMMKGSLLDQHGQLEAAAQQYGRALTQAPPMDRLDPAIRQAVIRAREVNRQFALSIRERVVADLSARGAHSGPELDRALNFLDTYLGIKRAFRQEPTHYNYPGMTSIEFYERDEFPWLSQLESQTDAILSEARQAMSEQRGFQPYVQYSDSVPLDQWADLNGSSRWSAFHLYHEGRRIEDNCLRCPQTVAILNELDQPKVVGQMPAAMFSVLSPRTRLPAHTGVANVRLVVHLPLIVPPNCGFRVGNTTRAWEIGKAFVFDDTIEHEAWNDSDETRVVFIFDIWNPRIKAAERELIATVLSSTARMMPPKATLSL
jgi:aspartyl/asparaginyl beta-hydroxylase (cupin superfamily)